MAKGEGRCSDPRPIHLFRKISLRRSRRLVEATQYQICLSGVKQQRFIIRTQKKSPDSSGHRKNTYQGYDLLLPQSKSLREVDLFIIECFLTLFIVLDSIVWLIYCHKCLHRQPQKPFITRSIRNFRSLCSLYCFGFLSRRRRDLIHSLINQPENYYCTILCDYKVLERIYTHWEFYDCRAPLNFIR